MTRTESGRELSVRHSFDISVVIEESVDIHRSEAVSTGLNIQISRSLIESRPSIPFGDPVQVHPLLAVAHAFTANRAHTEEPLML